MTAAAKTSKRDPNARRRVLEAALDVFAERGFDGATVRGIAERAGLQHGMIRYYFETKEKLWAEAVAFLFQRLEEELGVTPQAQALAEQGDIGAFRDFLRRYVHYCARHPDHARILMQETVSMKPRMRDVLEAHLKDTHIANARAVEALQAKGVFPKDIPPANILYMISGACQNLFALAPEVKVTLGYDALSTDAIDAHADLIVAMFAPET